MDATEKRLSDAYERAVERLRAIPKGDPRHIAVNREVVQAYRALQRYKQRRKT